MNTISYVDLEAIASLKMVWKELEKGCDMTYFQSYEWYEMLSNIYINSKFKPVVKFVVAKKDGVTKLIAPLILYRHTNKFVNKKGVYIFGRKGWSDYLNLIYDDIDEEILESLFVDIQKKYSLYTYYFEQLKESSFLYHFLKNKGGIVSEKGTECVGLEMPNSFEEYYQSLSKHARQNLRTAKNRSDKDGISFTIIHDDRSVDKTVCKIMREERVAVKNKKNTEAMTISQRIISSIKNKLEYKYPAFLPFFSDTKSKILSIYDGKELCAFFNYGIDSIRNSIVVMAVGTNDRYSRYSPGMLGMYSFINEQIEKGGIKYLDFTRGDEPYKLTLGGRKFHIMNVVFDFK